MILIMWDSSYENDENFMQLTVKKLLFIVTKSLYKKLLSFIDNDDD